jgi:subtilisin-like proprotein convertase family protein
MRYATLVAGLIGVLTAAFGPALAAGETFSNAASITINDAADATPYPSPIAVAGIGTSVVDVNATLSGFTHSFPADVDVLLAGPGGQSVMLMSDVPRDDPFCGSDVSGAILTFDDAAAGPIAPGEALNSGTYQPTNNDTFLPKCAPAPDVDTFPAPAPASPYGSGLAVFNGTDPNGTWSLYVLDDGGGDAGSIVNGWSLDIHAPRTAPPQPLTTPPDFDTAIFDGNSLFLRVKCPARFKPMCLGNAVGTTVKQRCTRSHGRRHCRPGSPITASVSANQKPGNWTVVTIEVKPQFKAVVASMARHPSKKLLYVRQLIHSKGFKHGRRQAVFHIYRVLTVAAP